VTANERHILDAPDGARPFDATALEGDLRNMWKDAGGGSSMKTGSVYRAALANLVVPLEAALAHKLTPVLVDTTRRHPARLFSIEAESPRGTGLRARVGALCHLREGGGGLVCSEQVVVDSDADSTPLLPSAIRSLLIGDLPTVLLDFHPGLDTPWVSELMDMADLVVVDSCIKEPGKEPAVWDFLRREGSRKVHDLAWARLLPWREILAEIFDRTAWRSIRRLEIEHSGEGFPPPPVWLLAGWLASRLGWTPEGGNRDGITLASEAGAVTVVLRGTGKGEGRVLERVGIRADAPHLLDLEIVHHGRETTARVTTRKPTASTSEVPFGYRELAACIVNEMHRHAPNPHLEDATRAAEAMMPFWNRT
jgi:glucose-6-phosphate dehydrogenase assembly protein OpcA